MGDLTCATDAIYYSTINSIDFNTSNKEISFKLTLNDNENISKHTMQFKNVSSFLWIERPKDNKWYSYAECENYELSSITFEKINTKTDDEWLNQYLMEYNVVIEIWETALLINATEVSIDNQSYSIERFKKGRNMKYNEIVLSSLAEKYNLNELEVNNDMFSVISFGKEKNHNYIILKNEICTDEDLTHAMNFIDNLSDKRFLYASFVFVAFVNKDFEKDDYMLFNGNSFLHTISYNLETSLYKYDNKFHYMGGKKIKELFRDIEQINFN